VSHEVFQGDDKQFYFRVKSGNGEIVGTSEGYTREADANRGYETFERIVLEGYAERMGKTPEAINFRNAVIDPMLDMFAEAPVFEKVNDEDDPVEYKIVVTDRHLNNVLESLGVIGTFGETAQDTIHRIMDLRTPAGTVLPSDAEDALELDTPVGDAPAE
jgi:uncharacterized protein YegP (UPF0339 family)